jgi:hypothetical protein
MDEGSMQGGILKKQKKLPEQKSFGATLCALNGDVSLFFKSGV